MPKKLGNYTFSGPYNISYPYTATARLQDRSGVYALLRENSNHTFSVIDVGESANVKTRITNHDRKACWRRNNVNHIAILYTPHKKQPGRMAIEQELRKWYHPACGSR